MLRRVFTVLFPALALLGHGQPPITVDTTFRFYYTPSVLQMGDNLGNGLWIPVISDVVQRLDGRILVVAIT